jgi:hypothetical protein
MYYLDYAKKVGKRYILNFFADTIEDLVNVPTNEPYITRNGFNYGIPLDSSVVTIVENGAQKNYVLQNGAYVAGGDIPSVLGTLEATENKTYKASDENLEGYSTVTVNVEPSLQTKSISSNGTVKPDEGYEGFSEVTVNVQPKLQEKIATANGAITPDETYYGLSKVTVNVEPKLQSKSVTANGTVTPDASYDGLSQVTVNVPPTTPKLQAKTATENGEVTPDSGYDGLSKVTVNVPATPTETKTVEPNFSKGSEILTPTEGKVFSSVTLTKPATLLPENIKKGVIICGIEGTYEAAGA